jgi:hypothetical protein
MELWPYCSLWLVALSAAALVLAAALVAAQLLCHTHVAVLGICHFIQLLTAGAAHIWVWVPV